jgi:hypothetical protein
VNVEGLNPGVDLELLQHHSSSINLDVVSRTNEGFSRNTRPPHSPISALLSRICCTNSRNQGSEARAWTLLPRPLPRPDSATNRLRSSRVVISACASHRLQRTLAWPAHGLVCAALLSSGAARASQGPETPLAGPRAFRFSKSSSSATQLVAKCCSWNIKAYRTRDN